MEGRDSGWRQRGMEGEYKAMTLTKREGGREGERGNSPHGRDLDANPPELLLVSLRDLVGV